MLIWHMTFRAPWLIWGEWGIWGTRKCWIWKDKLHKATQFERGSWRMCKSKMGALLLTYLHLTHLTLALCRATRKMTLSFLLAWRLPRLLPSSVFSLAPTICQTEGVNMISSDICVFLFTCCLVNQSTTYPYNIIYQRIYSVSLSTLTFANE